MKEWVCGECFARNTGQVCGCGYGTRPKTDSRDVALTLISEKVRFWSDPQRGPGGKALPPRCEDPSRAAELRKSLIEIAEHCRVALRSR